MFRSLLLLPQSHPGSEFPLKNDDCLFKSKFFMVYLIGWGFLGSLQRFLLGVCLLLRKIQRWNVRKRGFIGGTGEFGLVKGLFFVLLLKSSQSVCSKTPLKYNHSLFQGQLASFF